MIQKVPISTCPKLNALPVLNAEIRLIATTVPGSAQASMTATSSSPRPRKSQPAHRVRDEHADDDAGDGGDAGSSATS